MFDADASVATVDNSSSMSWTDIMARMSAEWTASLRSSVAAWRSTIEAGPEQFRALLAEYVTNLALAWGNLAIVHGLLVENPNVPFRQKYEQTLEGLRDRYYLLSALVMHDTQTKAQAEAAPVQAAPVVIVLGTVVFGLTAIAAAAAYISHTRELRDWTQYLREDLTARVEASKEGRQLQPSTAPSSADERPKPPDSGIPWWGWLIGAGAVGAVAWVTVPLFVGERR